MTFLLFYSLHERYLEYQKIGVDFLCTLKNFDKRCFCIEQRIFPIAFIYLALHNTLFLLVVFIERNKCNTMGSKSQKDT